MKKLILLGGLLAVGAFGFQEVSNAHGGTYRGPGDTVPPGGGGGGGGSGGPTTPGPSGPNAPNPSGPTTPGPAGPNTPGGGSRGPTTGAVSAGDDLTLWQFWWGFNKDPYLNLKSRIHGGGVQTGSDEFFIGNGMQDQAKNTLAPSEQTIREKIVPALIRALENETNNDIITGAMMSLAKIGDEQLEDGTSRFEEILRPFLKDGNQEIAESAALALGVLGNEKSIGTLRHLLQDDLEGRQLVGSEAGVNYRTRAFAAFGLGQIGHYTGDQAKRAEIVELLWEVCESPKGSTRDIKVAAVIAMGLVPLPVEGGSEDEESAAPRNRSEQVAYLLDFFQEDRDSHKHEMVRAHAPRSIVKLMEGLDDPQIKTDVVKALAPYVSKRGHIGTREMRQSASLAFGMLGDLDMDEEDKKIRECLMDATGNGEAQVKNFSVIALGQVGGRPGSGEEPMKGASEIRKHLQRHLSQGKSMVKPWAGLAIGVMERGLLDAEETPSKDALAALRQSLREAKSKDRVGAYAIACGIAQDVESESILLEKLDTMADDEVRGNLTIGLGLMQSVTSVKSIQEVVADSKYRGSLLKQAAIALGLLGDKKVVDQLVTMLAEAKTLTTQAALASALGFIGDTNSVDPLITMLENEEITPAARGFAAVALGIVADREPLPFNSKFAVDINYRANTVTLTGQGNGLLDIL